MKAAVTELAVLWEAASGDTVTAGANLLLHSTALILAGLALARVVKRCGAAPRAAVLRATLLAVVLAPCAALSLRWLGLPGAVIPIPMAGRAVSAAAEAEPDPRAPLALDAESGPNLDSVGASGSHAPPALGVLPVGDTQAASDAREPARPAGQDGPVGRTTEARQARPLRLGSVYEALAGIWIAGGLILSAMLAASHWQVSRIRRQAAEAGPSVLERCAALAQRLGVRCPAVLVSGAAGSPFLTGLWRPAIVLPTRSGGRVAVSEAVLVHELAHLKRCDCLWNLSARLLCALAWWQPLSWLLARRLEEASDELCDDYVLCGVGEPAAYARELSLLAEQFVPAPAEVRAGAGVVPFRSSVGRRVARILDRRRARVLRLSALATLGVSVLAVAAAAGVGLVRCAAAAPPEGQEAAALEPASQEPPEGALRHQVRQAVEDGDSARVEALLQEHADLLRSEGILSLLTAVSGGDVRTAAVLLDMGVSAEGDAERGPSPLSLAARQGHKDVVELLLARGAMVNPRSRWAPPPLYCAAQGGHAELVELLLRKGATLDPRKTGGWSALCAASRAGSIPTIEVLLAAGARVNELHQDGRTALHGAADGGKPEAVEFLLARGADVDAADAEGRTPLHLAVHNGDRKVVLQLLGAGAKLNVQEAAGLTPLMVAASYDPDLVQVLLEAGAAVGLRDAYGRAAIHFAARANAYDALSALLAAAADGGAEDQEGHTPLDYLLGRQQMPGRERMPDDRTIMLLLDNAADRRREAGKLLVWAAAKGRNDLVSAGLDRGASVNARSDEGYTALHAAVEHGQLETLKLLLAHDAEVNTELKHGDTPLHTCVALEKREAPEMARLLIQAGADVNAPSTRERTPLHVAAERASPETVALLLTAGADVHARDADGKTPLHIATEHGRTEVVAALLQAGADPDEKADDGSTPLRRAARQDSRRTFRALLAAQPEHDVDTAAFAGDLKALGALLARDRGRLEAMDGSGRTPLHYAIEGGQAEAVRFLLDQGAGAETRTRWSATPLYLAADWAEREIVHLLLDRGADANAATDNEDTPLCAAARSGDVEVVKALLAAGADPNARGAGSRTALMWAEEKRQREIAEVLRPLTRQ